MAKPGNIWMATSAAPFEWEPGSLLKIVLACTIHVAWHMSKTDPSILTLVAIAIALFSPSA
jgi:hypothetical protein